MTYPWRKLRPAAGEGRSRRVCRFLPTLNVRRDGEMGDDQTPAGRRRAGSEDQDAGPDFFGPAVLDNADVNGTLVGQGAGPRLGNHGDGNDDSHGDHPGSSLAGLAPPAHATSSASPG
jgi:hypothetical protein